jgi:flagellin
MGLSINTNIEALNAQRQLGKTQMAFGKSVEKLSSGLRINRAADDAAGLAVSEKLRAQVRGTNVAMRNAQDGISMIQTAEGALNEMHAMLQRMRELSVQAANGALGDADRTRIQAELTQLRDELDRVATSTKFNGNSLLTGSYGVAQTGGTAEVGFVGADVAISAVSVAGAKASTTYTLTDNTDGTMTLDDGDGNSQTVTLDATVGADGEMVIDFNNMGVRITVVGDAAAADADVAADLDGLTVITGAGTNATFQVGANGSDTMGVAFGDARTSALFTGADATNLTAALAATLTADEANDLIGSVDAAIALVSAQRGTFGAAQNRLEHAIANLGVTAENLSASESRIRDLDVPAEMVAFTKAQILQQAGIAVLAQANQAPSAVLALLR